MNYQIADSFVFALLLIFCRVGTFCMFVPAIGDMAIPMRIRLVFAILLSFLIMTVITDQIPAKPTALVDFVILIFNEVAIGLSIGIAIKVIQSALHVMGLTFAYQSGLSSGTIFDPSQASQGSIYGNFLTITFVVLLLATDMHLNILRSIRFSYDVFGFGFFSKNYADFVNLIVRVSSDAFNVGVRLSAPFLVVGVLANLGAGVLSRLMPQMQVFFILMPAQIFIHSIIFMVTMGAALMWFVEYYNEYFKNIFG